MLVHFFYKLGESSRSLTWDKAKASYILGQRKYNESTSLVMQGGLSLFSLHSYSWGVPLFWQFLTSEFGKCYGHLAGLILIYAIMEKSQYVEADLFFLFRSFTKHSLRSGTRHLSFPKQENPWFCMSRTITRSFQPLVLAIAPWNTACFLRISLPINGYRSKG